MGSDFEYSIMIYGVQSFVGPSDFKRSCEQSQGLVFFLQVKQKTIFAHYLFMFITSFSLIPSQDVPLNPQSCSKVWVNYPKMVQNNWRGKKKSLRFLEMPAIKYKIIQKIGLGPVQS